MRGAPAILAAALTLTLGAGAAGAVPASFTFTGRLLDGDAPVVDAVTLDLALYGQVTGGTPIWSETHETTADDGLVSVPLGGQSPLDVASFDGADLWLAVTVNGVALEPRFQLRSVPYAMRAEVCDDAEAVGGIPGAQVQQVLSDNCAVGSAIRDIAADGAVTCEPVGGGGAVFPSGMVAFFDVACPTGWTPYTALTGRVPVGATADIGEFVGTQLGNLTTRTITQVPPHNHGVDPPSTVSSDAGGHTPTMSPSSSGAHAHDIDLGHQYNGTGSQIQVATSGISADGTTHSDGAHSHTFAAVPDHQHSVNIAPFSSTSTGTDIAAGAVDVTMPYMQLRACRKD